ncbi:MAG: protein-L-isoaspartate(D-aspartate) O-methyltransferase [Actinomycetota bacterium]
MTAGRPPRGRRPADLVAAARAAGVRDPRVLAALGRVPRDAFVPRGVAHHAYADVPIPIPGGQVTSQPSLIAAMIEALDLHGTETVLEVGTGHGFQTALLASLAAEVWSVERLPTLAAAARANLAARGVTNAHVVVGDGTEGLAAHAPYDAIVVSAAFPAVPPPLAAQLAPGGRLVQPIGPGGDERVVLFVRDPDGLRLARRITDATFVPLVGRHGFAERDVTR